MAGDRWVCFDVGETLVDETRVWSVWADVLGVTRFTFMAALGAAIERGNFHLVFGIVGRPGWSGNDIEVEAIYGGFQASDLYPDAIPTIEALKRAGYRIAIFANQPARRTAQLQALGVAPDLMAMSGEWNVHKPAPEFYERVLREMDADASDVAYVGDRLDNDVRPSAAAGIRPVFLRRGPWGVIGDGRGDPPPGTLVVDSLTELVGRINEWWP